jgi:hypothetical protein
MTGARHEVRTPPAGRVPSIGPAPAGLGAFLAAGLAAVALAGGLAWTSHRALGLLHDSLDGAALAAAGASFDQALERQRAQVTASVAVLAGDTRVRAPMVAPTFDEATVRDLLDDLKTTSGAALLAVLDPSGKVRAVTGVVALHELELGSSPVVKTARERPNADVWSFPDRVLVMGVAPVRAADRTVALLAIGYEIGGPVLAGVKQALGVEGGLVIGERVAASSTTDPALLGTLRTAAALPEQRDHLLDTPRPLVARVTRASPAASAAKVVWLVSHRHAHERAVQLQLLGWLPVVLVTATFLLLFSLARRAVTRARFASERQRG